MRAFLLLFGICGLLGFVAIGQWPRQSAQPGLYAGRIEVDSLLLAPESAGTISTLAVGEGDWVEKGSAIASLDAPELEAARAKALAFLERAKLREKSAVESAELTTATWTREVEQARAALVRAQQSARLVDLGPRAEQVKRAEAAVGQARALAEEADRELARVTQLAKTNSAPERERDHARTEQAVRRAALAQAQSSLDEARAGSRAEEKAGARSEVDRAAAALALAEAGGKRALIAAFDRSAAAQEVLAAAADLRVAEDRLRKARIVAPREGLVDEVLRRPGEVLRPGDPVVRLLDYRHPYLKAFLASDVIDRLSLGGKVRAFAGAPAREFAGRVQKISRRAEFTPKDVQTRERRVSLVYEVKIGIDDPKNELKAGQPADVAL